MTLLALAIKDVTSILSMNRDARAGVLAAFREIHDGHWSRDVGTDGGKSLKWSGRLVVIGACTTAWDQAHAAISAMGDRFVLLRMDSTKGRMAAGRKSIGNTGSETKMRTELAAAVAAVVTGCNPKHDLSLTDEETERLLAAADLVTLARTESSMTIAATLSTHTHPRCRPASASSSRRSYVAESLSASIGAAHSTSH